MKCVAFGFVSFLLSILSFGAQVSFSSKPPALGPNDIANLQGSDSEGDNVSSGDPAATYIADDRPTQGQTFTTSTNADGYLLRTLTLQEVSFPTYTLVPDLSYTVRITRPAGANLLPVASERAESLAAITGNFATFADGAELGSGSGRFITFTFQKPVLLNPGTTYGFDLTGGNTRHYWQSNGTSSNAYPGGSAYSVSTNRSMIIRSGDHVFAIGLTLAKPPGPGQAALPSQDRTSP